MRSPDEEQFSGAALIVEGGIIAILASNILSLTTGWRWDWVFNLALAILMVLYVLRAASTLVDDPKMARIRLTTPLSTICLQFCIIGAAANSAIYFSTLNPVSQQPVFNFVILTGLAIIAVITIDEIFLGEFIDTWTGVIYNTTGDNPVGELLREAADWVNDAIESWGDDFDDPATVSYKRGLTYLALLGGLLVVGLSPIVYLGASLLGSAWTAFMVLFMLILIRDLTRYLYFRFGPAQSFNEVKTMTPTSILVQLINIVLVTGALGAPI
jgi:hypothetical protein